jgi:zinc D-Ala-D-Ala carboxypeptidase
MAKIRFKHFSLIPKSFWVWPNFTPREIACRCCGEIIVDTDAMDKLQATRTHLGSGMTVNCGYRCPIHNARVGGAPLSEHKKGGAFDIRLTVPKIELYGSASIAGFTGYGLKYNSFLHMDNGRRRTW